MIAYGHIFLLRCALVKILSLLYDEFQVLQQGWPACGTRGKYGIAVSRSTERVQNYNYKRCTN